MKEFIILLLLGLVFFNLRKKRYKDIKYHDTSIMLTIPSSNTIPTFTRLRSKSNIKVHSAIKGVEIEYKDKQIIWNDLSPIMDQGTFCGSCWSFSISAMFTDRLRIKYGFQDIISPISLAACLVCSNGVECNEICNGGYLDITAQHLVDVGADVEYTNKYICNIKSYKIKAKRAYKVNKYNYFDYLELSEEMKLQCIQENEMLILNEIEANGPVTGIIKICTDENHNFYKYTGGIYGADRHICIHDDNFHAITIVGSGTEDGIKYWLCKNSWNYSWGEKGYFKIIRGIDYMLIESDVHAVEV